MKVTCKECGAKHELADANDDRENWEQRGSERVLKVNCDADPASPHVFEIVEPVEAS